MSRYARVYLDRAGDRALDYLVPEAMAGSLEVGTRVRVPLRARLALGTVVEILDRSDVKSPRAIHQIIGDAPMIRPKLIEIARWISEYYCCPLQTAMSCVLPQVVRQAEVSPRRLNFARLLRRASSAELDALTTRAPRQADALRLLQNADGPKPVAQLAQEAGVSEQVFRTLERKGWLTIETGEVARDPFAHERFLPTSELALNAEQRHAVDSIKEAIQTPGRPLLLFGVTGSGKTEIYLQAIRHAIAQGRTALVLVPEISLTPQTVERFKARFADAQREVAVLHSHLSGGERYDEWRKIHSGGARIVIGARSAVFAPLEHLGIIIVDEEHEGTYKQEEAPRYHARDVAVLRAKQEQCAVVLGSATPSMESWHNCTTGKYLLLKLSQRVDDRRMPIVRVLDLRKAPRPGGAEAICAPALLQAIEGRLSSGEQTILFLNRRGFSTTMVCQACGHVCQCPNCSVALTFHRDVAQLACHICGYRERAPKVCPICKDPGIRHSGVGTQKVEDVVRRLFPRARVARMDADALTRKNTLQQTLQAFKEGAIDILVGTQMIAKGLHFPRVTLVGIINADLSLHLPDFRAGERTFQLLTQVAGRAGRGDVEGEVLVQTFTPFSPSIQFARHHDFDGFAEQELEFRERFGFPPFTRMVLITVRARMRERAEFTGQTLVRKLKEKIPKNTLIGDCVPAPLEKAHGYYRFQITLRGPSARTLSSAIQQTLAVLPLPEDVFAAVDVDPVNLL
jgi:primosomal protein N' (replication factor Y) (superfamily II helicase)